MNKLWFFKKSDCWLCMYIGTSIYSLYWGILANDERKSLFWSNNFEKARKFIAGSCSWSLPFWPNNGFDRDEIPWASSYHSPQRTRCWNRVSITCRTHVGLHGENSLLHFAPLSRYHRAQKSRFCNVLQYWFLCVACNAELGLEIDSQITWFCCMCSNRILW